MKYDIIIDFDTIEEAICQRDGSAGSYGVDCLFSF